MTKEWNKWEGTIKMIYKDQGKTLEETMKIMKEEHNFVASVRAFRSRLKRWGCVKYHKNQGQGGPVRATLTPTTPSDSGVINESTTCLQRRVSYQSVPSPPMSAQPGHRTSIPGQLPLPPAPTINAPYPSPETPSVQYSLEYSTELGNPSSGTPPNHYADQQQQQQHYCSPVAYNASPNAYLEMERQLSGQNSHHSGVYNPIASRQQSHHQHNQHQRQQHQQPQPPPLPQIAYQASFPDIQQQHRQHGLCVDTTCGDSRHQLMLTTGSSSLSTSSSAPAEVNVEQRFPIYGTLLHRTTDERLPAIYNQTPRQW